jgi:hypothetical protein
MMLHYDFALSHNALTLRLGLVITSYRSDLIGIVIASAVAKGNNIFIASSMCASYSLR